MKVFITRPIPKLYQPLSSKFEVDVYEKDEVCPRDILLKRIKDVDAVLTQWEDYVDKEFLDSAGKNLKIVANFATGTDRVDKDEANKRGVIITNTASESLYAATAEAVVSLLTTVARRTTKLYVQNILGRIPKYSPIGDMGIALRDKTSGIVGMGNIGSIVAKIMHNGYNNNIIYFNKSKNLEVESSLYAKNVALSRVFLESDFIFLTIPHNKGTSGIITNQLLSSVRQKCILASISPAEIIDNHALVKLIKNGKIYGAGLDIYPKDIKPLKNHNLILTAHSANAEKETTNIMVRLCVKNIINVLDGKAPLTEVKN
jgi:glyoxylate reductase